MTADSSSPALTDDAGLRAQRAAEQHLMDVWEAEQVIDDAQDDGTPDHELPLSPASAPWDGCETCVVREVIHAAWPILRDDVLASLRGAGFDDAAAFLSAEYGVEESGTAAGE